MGRAKGNGTIVGRWEGKGVIGHCIVMHQLAVTIVCKQLTPYKGASPGEQARMLETHRHGGFSVLVSLMAYAAGR